MTADILHKINASPMADPNSNYNIIQGVIENAKNKHILSKKVKFKKHKHKHSKWITCGTIKSINYRDNMYKNLKMTHPDSQQFTILKANLNTYNNILKRNILLQKKLY